MLSNSLTSWQVPSIPTNYLAFSFIQSRAPFILFLPTSCPLYVGKMKSPFLVSGEQNNGNLTSGGCLVFHSLRNSHMNSACCTHLVSKTIFFFFLLHCNTQKSYEGSTDKVSLELIAMASRSFQPCLCSINPPAH